ncbi:MAG TPA: host attachment protein [Rudaea sp.]
MATTWILVADSARARLFEIQAVDVLSELRCYANAQRRAGNRGESSDRAPTVNESVGQARHALEPHTDARQKSADVFARSLRDELDHGRTAHHFQRLVLIAPPRFLGALHAAFDKPLRDTVVAEIRRDFTRMSPNHIRAALAPRLFHGVDAVR